MKLTHLFFLFFLASPEYFFAQPFVLIVKTDDQPSVHGESYWNYISVKKNADVTFHKRRPGTPDTVKITSAGGYTVTLHSQFGHTVKKNINLRTDTTITFSIRKRFKKASPRVLSARLKEGDSLFVLHNASGTPVNEKLCITKQKGKFYAFILSASSADNVFIQQKTELDKVKLLAVKDFEKQAALHNKAAGCSAIEAYTVFLNRKYYTVNDGTCLWSGYSNLIKQLFP